MTTIAGHLMENKMDLVKNSVDLLSQSQAEHPWRVSDKMNYYNLSPNTINRIAKLSLEELLLRVGSQTDVQGNLVAAAPPTTDSLNPLSAMDSSSAKHHPPGKDPTTINGKASALQLAKAKPKHVKIKDAQKQTYKKKV